MASNIPKEKALSQVSSDVMLDNSPLFVNKYKKEGTIIIFF